MGNNRSLSSSLLSAIVLILIAVLCSLFAFSSAASAQEPAIVSKTPISKTFHYMFSSESSNVQLFYSKNGGELTEIETGQSIDTTYRDAIAFFVKSKPGYGLPTKFDSYYGTNDYYEHHQSDAQYSTLNTAPLTLTPTDGIERYDTYDYTAVKQKAKDLGCTHYFYYSLVSSDYTYREFKINAHPVDVHVSYSFADATGDIYDSNVYHHTNVSEDLSTGNHAITITQLIPKSDAAEKVFTDWTCSLDGKHYTAGDVLQIDDLWNFIQEKISVGQTIFAIEFTANFETKIEPKLTVEKSVVPKWAQPGETVLYEIKVTNPIPDTFIQDITITDPVPSLLDFYGATGIDGKGNTTGNDDAKNIVFGHINKLDYGETVTMTFTAYVKSWLSEGVITNTAYVKYGNTTISAECPLLVGCPDVSIDTTCSVPEIEQESTATFTATFTENSNLSALYDADVFVYVPRGTTLDASSISFVGTIEELSPIMTEDGFKYDNVAIPKGGKAVLTYDVVADKNVYGSQKNTVELLERMCGAKWNHTYIDIVNKKFAFETGNITGSLELDSKNDTDSSYTGQGMMGSSSVGANGAVVVEGYTTHKIENAQENMPTVGVITKDTAKEDIPSVSKDDTITHTVVVENTSNELVENVVVSQAIPEGLSIPDTAELTTTAETNASLSVNNAADETEIVVSALHPKEQIELSYELYAADDDVLLDFAEPVVCEVAGESAIDAGEQVNMDSGTVIADEATPMVNLNDLAEESQPMTIWDYIAQFFQNIINFFTGK